MGKSWNLSSTRINPTVVGLVCATLAVLNGLEQKWHYVLPLALLAINAGLALAFWSWRLKKRRGRRWRTVAVSLGLVSRAAAVTSLVTLVAALVVVAASPDRARAYADGLDAKFWVLWSWAVLEAVHGHVYKLKFGRRNTLEDVLSNRRWREAGAPLGGAIGEQLRKLRHRHSDRMRRGTDI
ncbi:hypothetical protein H8E07_20870 [bacterium]|nr:hypothetical protein [bacterium]